MFNITKRTAEGHPDATIIKCEGGTENGKEKKGHFGDGEAVQLANTLRREIRNPATTKILVELDVGYMSTGAIRALQFGLRHAEKNGVGFGLLNPSGVATASLWVKNAKFSTARTEEAAVVLLDRQSSPSVKGVSRLSRRQLYTASV